MFNQQIYYLVQISRAGMSLIDPSRTDSSKIILKVNGKICSEVKGYGCWSLVVIYVAVRALHAHRTEGKHRKKCAESQAGRKFSQSGFLQVIEASVYKALHFYRQCHTSPAAATKPCAGKIQMIAVAAFCAQRIATAFAAACSIQFSSFTSGAERKHKASLNNSVFLFIGSMSREYCKKKRLAAFF